MNWGDWPQTAMQAWSVGDLGAPAGLNGQSRARYEQILESFCRFCQASGLMSPSAISTDLCRQFVTAPVRADRAPGTATSRLRLTVLRSALDVLVAAGLVASNPTTGLSVAHESRPRKLLPLTPAEARRLAGALRCGPVEAAWPACCGLALLGAAHEEIAVCVAADAMEAAGQVVLGRDSRRRLVLVPARLEEILIRRIEAQRQRSWRAGEPWDPAATPLALTRPRQTYPVNSLAPTVSANLARGLRIAGVCRPGVRPKSIREYAANEVYAQTQRIEDVAERLAISSFDSAAFLIHSDWQNRWGAALRAGEFSDS